MNKKLCLDLKKALNVPVVYHGEQLEKAISLANSEYEKHRSRERIGYVEFLFQQIPFMGRRIWIFQGSILILMWLLLTTIFQEDFKYIAARHLPDLLCLFAIFITMTGLPFLCRSYRYKMQEVETASFMSMSGLLSARLIVIGLGDGIFLLAVSLVTFSKVSISTALVIFYLLLPFLVSCCGCIFILRSNRSQYNVFACEFFCLLILSLQFLFHTLVPQAYHRAALTGWVVLSVFFAAVLAFQIYKLIVKFNRICVC
ncbi:hypothetical protein ACFHWD_12790 [Clostridium sp. MT-14]|uniref:Uncharacterized protein n=1 Tax=Clostridium aromativorans TaxID=2836848 RepID=A0ABS8N7M4_9CLOT|nr:hypothetical protein [Clostridium aromativorans]MCC9295810.1 hypothetical protein [Clostridium aromativorans]